MKLLRFKLVSLIPDQYLAQPKEFLSQQDQVDHSAAYIKNLRERVEELRRRKTQLMTLNYGTNNMVVESKQQQQQQQPVVIVNELGSDDVEVVLITKNFMISEVITIIEQEAAQVLAVSIATIDCQIIHTIHAQVKISRVGVDAATIKQRIQDLISSTMQH